MKNNELLDSWSRSGCDISEFCRTIEMLDDSTRAIDVITDSLELLSVNADATAKDYTALRIYNYDQAMNKKLASHTGLKTESAISAGYSEELIEELQLRSKLAIRYGKTFYLTSKGLIRDLAARAELGGMAIYDPTEQRDAYIVSRYAKNPARAIGIVRYGENPKVGKLFAMASKGYCYVPQKFIIDLLNNFKKSMGETECKAWTVDHSLTLIEVFFTERAEDLAATYKLPDMPIPGIRIETSDTGDCSIIASSIWKTKRSTISGESYSRKHSGRFSPSEVLDGITNTVFSTYTKLPERLCELAVMPLSNPGAVIRHVMKSLKADKVMGKKRAASLTDALILELDISADYTAYDIAMIFLDLPDRVGFIDKDEEKFLKRDLEKMCYKAPFLKYDSFVAEEPDDIVLSPAE